MGAEGLARNFSSVSIISQSRLSLTAYTCINTEGWTTADELCPCARTWHVREPPVSSHLGDLALNRRQEGLEGLDALVSLTDDEREDLVVAQECALVRFVLEIRDFRRVLGRNGVRHSCALLLEGIGTPPCGSDQS